MTGSRRLSVFLDNTDGYPRLVITGLTSTYVDHMSVVKVWRTADRAWRVEVHSDGAWRITERGMALAIGRSGGALSAWVMLTRIPDAPDWDDLIED